MGEEKKEYEKWKSDKNSWKRKLASNMNAGHLIIFFLLFVGGSWAMTSGKIKPSYFYLGVIGILLVVIFSVYKGPSKKQLIPEWMIKQICQDTLENKKRIGIEIPFDADVRVMLQGEPKYEQDFTNSTSGIVRRNVGFEVARKGYVKKGIIGIEPYTGEIMGFEFVTTGYTGRETRETIKVVPVGTFDTKNPTM